MGFLNNIFQRAEKYDPLHPRDPGLVSMFGGRRNTSAGVSITEQSAMSITAVYSAVTIIAEHIAMLPYQLFKTDGTTNVLQDRDARNTLISRRPNRFQNSMEYREMMLITFLLRGRAVAEIITNEAGAITDLIPRHPDYITPFWAPDDTIAFVYQPIDGKRRILLSSEVVDFRGPSTDGLNCLSPIRQNEETLGIAKAAEQFAGRFFGSGTVVSGVLETDAALSDTAYQRLKEWTDRHQGVGRSHNPAILEEGLSWKPVSVNAADAQLLQTRSYQVEDVARIYRIPAYKLNRMDSVKFNTTEQQAIDFVTDTLLPRVTRFELAHNRSILNADEQRTLHTEINLKGLLRGDSKTRSEFYKSMWNMGVYNANRILQLENENPIDGGDRYYVPVNVVPADRMDDMVDKNTTTPTPGAPQRDHVRSIFVRLNNAELGAESRGGCMVAFYGKHKDHINKLIEPLIDSLTDVIKRDSIIEYFDAYYLQLLTDFETNGKVTQDRFAVDTEKFLTWMQNNAIKK